MYQTIFDHAIFYKESILIDMGLKLKIVPDS
jgi:hypothetical protein